MSSSNKRRNENSQVRKEDYDNGEAETACSGPIERASEEVLSKRKMIIRSDELSIPTSRSNPASFKNPFASVAFAAGPAPFSFPVTSTTTTTAATTTTKSTTTNYLHSNDIIAAFKSLVKEPNVDLYPHLLDCMRKLEQVKPKQPNAVLTSQPVPSSTSSLFNFGIQSQTNLSSNKTSVEATLPPSLSLFSNPSSSSSSSYSTGIATAPLPSTAAISSPAPNNTAHEEGEDDNEVMPNEPPTIVIREENPDEDVLFDCQAKYGKFMDNAWKLFSVGTLRLYRNRVNPNQQRIVIRNSMGKVILNLAIFKGMKLRKSMSKNKGSITFMAVEDATKGMENFTLLVKKEDLDELHTTIEKMAAK